MAIAFNKNGETKEIATYQSCISNITVSDPSRWGLSKTASGGSLKLTVPKNQTTSQRSQTVTINYKAGTSNCSKTVDITQAAGDAPTPTTCSNGSTLGIGECVPAQASSTAVKVGTWSKSPSDCPDSWTRDTDRSFSGTLFVNTSTIDFRSNGDIYAQISGTNETSSERVCRVPTKLGSIEDYFTITQCAGYVPPTECAPFLDSCCGKSVAIHPLYDVSMGGEVGQGAGTDSFSADCTFHLSSGKPSWMDVRIDYQTGLVWYDSLSANTSGWDRFYEIAFALDTDTSSNNYCPTASVVMKQKPTAASSASVTTFNATCSVKNEGSETKLISGLSFSLTDGTYITTTFSATIAAGQTYTYTVHFPTYYDGAALMPSSVAYPVKVRFTDNTYALGTLTNRTLSSGGMYSITFS